MPDGPVIFLVLAACASLFVLPRALAKVGVRGVEKAAESRQMRQPLRFWLVPGETSAAELETALRAVVDEVGVGVATARVATKKGGEVVECLIDHSGAQDPDLARAQFLKAARAIDGDCVLDL